MSEGLWRGKVDMVVDRCGCVREGEERQVWRGEELKEKGGGCSEAQGDGCEDEMNTDRDMCENR